MRRPVPPAILAVLLLLSAAAVVDAADFTPIGSNAGGDAYSAELDRVVRDGRLLIVNVRTEYAEPRRIASADKPVFTAFDQIAFDCDAGTFAIVARRYVANDGTAIPGWVKSKAGLELRPAPPGSMSESLMRAVCAASAPSAGPGGS